MSQRERDLLIILRAMGIPEQGLPVIKKFLNHIKVSDNVGNEDAVRNDLAHLHDFLISKEPK